MSNSWGLDKHNRNHSHPTQTDVDHDINIPIMAFTQEDIHRKLKPAQFIVKYQAYFFFPILFISAFNLQFHSIQFLLQKKGKYQFIEVALMLLHYVCYFGVLFYLLPF